MIKIAHEAPIDIMGMVRDRTDYCYALVHLFETHPDYYEHFEQSLKLGRKVILDNSIFELGESFDPAQYADWIKKLKPTEYIIPDSLEDYAGTIVNAERWMSKYNNLPGKKIGVVHGQTMTEFIHCYNSLVKLGVDKIAFTFRGQLYESHTLPDANGYDTRFKLMAWCLGRIKTIEKLLETDIINRDIPHHLLGCSLPQEFIHYKGDKFNFIESLDTSNPVVLGLDFSRYDEQGGVSYKADSLLFERIDEEVGSLQKSIIKENINSFRENIKN